MNAITPNNHVSLDKNHRHIFRYDKLLVYLISLKQRLYIYIYIISIDIYIKQRVFFSKLPGSFFRGTRVVPTHPRNWFEILSKLISAYEKLPSFPKIKPQRQWNKEERINKRNDMKRGKVKDCSGNLANIWRTYGPCGVHRGRRRNKLICKCVN